MVVVGDVHGRWDLLLTGLTRYGVQGQEVLQVGDFGLGFLSPAREDEALRRLDRHLVATDCRLWAIRGNHDNPSRFLAPAAPGHAGMAPGQYEAIQFVPDYTVLHLEERPVLCVGGAVSIDRRVRAVNAYWPDEGFRLDLDRLAALDLDNLFAVITHSAPAGLAPIELGPLVQQFAKADPALIAELRAERQALARFQEAVLRRATPSYWFYGHFHAHASEWSQGTRYVLLDVLQFYQATPAF